MRFIAILAVALAACTAPSEDVVTSSSSIDARTPLRLNQIQTKGTHNSYQRDASIEEQLAEQGLRNFEFDLHVDGDLALRVFHTDGDRGTHCKTLGACLSRIKRWSDAHPRHVPIFVMLEEKDIRADARAYYDVLDREVLSVFPRERIVTPASVGTGAWPLLDDARGKIGLYLTAMTAERKRAFRENDHVAFMTGWFDEPDVRVLVVDDPLKDAASLADAVTRGYLVRTRADVAMKEVKNGDERRFRAGLGGGAHFISTDQPEPGRIIHRDYDLAMPVARCNAVIGPSWCKCLADFDVESM